MSNKMLIDASHPEETRVVITRGNRIEEFDFESQSKKQLKGNIYLARITRVEPSLQAAFVEYGGNRHGFLALSEIHPDYYQIPVADRQAILADEAEEAEADEEDEKTEKTAPAKRKRRRSGRGRAVATTVEDEADSEVAAGDEADLGERAEGDVAAESPETSDNDANRAQDADAGDPGEDDAAKGRGGPAMAANVRADVISEPLSDDAVDKDATAETGNPAPTGEGGGEEKEKPKKRTRRSSRAKRTKASEAADDNGDDGEDGDSVESVGAEDALEELSSRRRQTRRQYKIQEVVKRRQILLVQVVKEERSNKGAALTTYLSLAGRYSVLMPNTARGGGISRKITNVQDRKRLKEVVRELDVPQGMGVILRTAGANRTKAEIKRDYEYLMRLWVTIRALTMESAAPALVYEEGSLIKRSVRDLYNKDIGEILVAGDEGYREAKDFMRMLMPSHAKVVQPYKDRLPIFARNGIEGQLDSMLQPQVTLKSGGYLIINQTEALVAIDVNSGRSTREHSVEDTALRTNLEAAEEVARQLRLRDLAGLIVIDFIDMEEKRNNRSVEKRLKECLKHDRARIQIGRISHFGLLEMSRQRIRASVLESTMQTCQACYGAGHIRSESSVALHVLRGIEEYLLKDSGNDIMVRIPTATALYVLNNKRANLSEFEERFGLSIKIEADETLGVQHFRIVKGAPSGQPAQDADRRTAQDADSADSVADDDASPDRDEDSGRKRRRRRRRKSGKNADGDAGAASDGDESHSPDNEEDGEEPRKRRRGHQNDGEATVANETGGGMQAGISADVKGGEPETEAARSADQAAIGEEASGKPRRTRRRKKDADASGSPANAGDDGDSATPDAVAEATDRAESEPAETRPTRRARRKSSADDGGAKAATEASSEPVVTSVVSEQSGEADDPEQPRKAGWWKRKGFF